MWIICAGGKRSGSTLQYNVISRIVEETGKGKRITHFKAEEFLEIKKKNVNYKGFKVIKTHALTKEFLEEIEKNEAIVFHTYRDIRDVVVSSINKGWIKKNNENIVQFVNNYLIEYKNWKELNYEIHSRKYEDFANDLLKEIKYILDILNLELSNEKAKLISEELSLTVLKKEQKNISEHKISQSFGQTFHKNTLLHTNHINDGSSNQFLKLLNGSEIALIESLSYDFLIKNDYELHWTRLNKFLSYSQHADDYLAWQLLGKKTNGVVIEVGAFDGRHLSNSYSLSQLGWKSICIEPNPKIFKYLIENRPDAININNAIVGDENISKIEFYSEEIGVLSGCTYNDEDIKRRYKNRGLEYKEPKKLVVPATTLNTLCDNLKINDIDLLSIDVEGFELEVLKGLDLSKYNVNLFVVEANNQKEKDAILNFFKSYKGYVYVGNNFQNLFIMRKAAINKRDLRNLDYFNYTKAKQIHPIDEKFFLDSISPKFEKSSECIKIQKYISIF